MTTSRDSLIQSALEAALDLAAHRRWEELTLADIATAAGIELADFHGVASKQSLGEALDAFFDRAMTGEGIDFEDSPRERLFDVVMLRIEAMEAQRAGVLSYLKWRDRTPIARAKALVARKSSADWALVAAHLDDDDQALPRDVRALAVAYAMAKAETAWRNETDPGFARTMAALDKALRELESRAKWARGFRRRRSGAPNRETNPEDAGAPEAPPEETSPT